MASGYRTPADDVETLELVDYERMLDEDADLGLDDALDPPAVRVANALLINALAKGASMIHIEPPQMARPVRFRVDGLWHDEVALAPDVVGAVARRLKIMAMLSPHDDGPAVGQLFILLGSDDDKPRQFLVLVRPAELGQRVLVRTVTEAERRRLTWPAPAGAVEAEEKLRWDREQLFRIADTMDREVVETTARTFLAAAEALLPGAHRQVMEVRALLADLADGAGATERAIREIEDAIGLGRSFGAPAMSTSLLVERLAELRLKHHDLDGAIEARHEAVRLVEATLAADDPYLSGVLGRLADTLVVAGRLDEAEVAYDEAIRMLSELTGDDDLELRTLVSARTRAISPLG